MIPVQSTVERTYVPQGTTVTTLNFNFKYTDKEYIKIAVDGVLKASTSYNIVAQVITFTPAVIGGASGSDIVVYVDMPVERANDLIQGSPIYAADLNTQLDRLTLMMQQGGADKGRGVTFPNSDAPTINAVLPKAIDRANRALVFGFDGAVGVGSVPYEQYLSQAKQYSLDAKSWADAASQLAVPAGSIGATKMSPTDIFTFQEVVAQDGNFGTLGVLGYKVVTEDKIKFISKQYDGRWATCIKIKVGNYEYFSVSGDVILNIALSANTISRTLPLSDFQINPAKVQGQVIGGATQGIANNNPGIFMNNCSTVMNTNDPNITITAGFNANVVAGSSLHFTINGILAV